jgi:outer membrane biosynthesis protein TonB
MRAGILISAVSHVVLVALALLGTPKLFDNPLLETIEVDLVRPQDVELPKEPEKKPPDEKPAPWNPLPEASAAQSPTPAPEAAAPQAKPQPSPPAPAQQALGPQIPSPSVPAQPSATPWIFDPVNIPKLMDLPNAPQPGFDAESTATANLSSDERSVLKAHLQKCWQLPSGMSAAQSTRVVLRVFLRPDGTLVGEPMLIEASASRDGPRLMQAAIRTLKDCQPFAFLPADKYREWKVLDLSFSPRDMGGG